MIGGAIGLVSGYVGGRVDLFIMQVMDVLLSFPSLILGLIVMALLGPELVNLVFAIALTADSAIRPHRPRPGAEPEGAAPSSKPGARWAFPMRASCSCTCCPTS